MKTLTNEQIDLLNTPLPPEALKPHPTKSYLTTINAIYVTERLNQVFGVGSWQTHINHVDTIGKMVVVQTTLEIPEYGIHLECYGGNDNVDQGDAYKGAVTDALTKIGSWLGIGAHVWKNEGTPNGKPLPQQTAKQKPLRERIIEYLSKMDEKKRNEYLNYFQLSSVDAITDQKAKEIADFEKQKAAKEKKQ